MQTVQVGKTGMDMLVFLVLVDKYGLHLLFRAAVHQAINGMEIAVLFHVLQDRFQSMEFANALLVPIYLMEFAKHNQSVHQE